MAVVRADPRRSSSAPVLLAGLFCVAACGAGCTRELWVGGFRPSESNHAGAGGVDAVGGAGRGGNGGADTTAGAGRAGESGQSSCQPIPCGQQTYACGDCVDNDDDGLTDAADPDCTGPCQDTEASFFDIVVAQDSGSCRQDCYFDSDSGSGNDGCSWTHTCDPLSVAPDFPPEGDGCAYDETDTSCADLLSNQSEQCQDTCLPLTPNGCDCFGCCTIPGVDHAVWLASRVGKEPSCSFEAASDPTRCKPCTQVPSCLNPCDTCELCLGKSSLPAECDTDGGAAARCPQDAQPCGLDGEPPCSDGEFCLTGCCVRVN